MLHMQHKFRSTQIIRFEDRMAISTVHTRSLTALPGVVADIFTGIFDALVRIGEANTKVRQINALSALSDAELAARGMRREDIIRRVMGEWV